MTPEQSARWATPDRIRELLRERFIPWPLYAAPIVKPVRDRKLRPLSVGKEPK